VINNIVFSGLFYMYYVINELYPVPFYDYIYITSFASISTFFINSSFNSVYGIFRQSSLYYLLFI